MDGAGSKTVFAITFDRAAGRGNGFGQEMGNPIFGPFGGVGAGGSRACARVKQLEGEHAGARGAADNTFELRVTRKGQPRRTETPQEAPGVAISP